MQNILHTIEEGVHVIDADGVSILYNRAMEAIEGLKAEEVLGKHLLEVFPTWQAEDSTLLTAIKTGRIIDERKQSYLNLKKKRISTVNTTIPIFQGKKIIGAVEIAKNYTEVNQLSEKIIDLQQKLIEVPKAQILKPRKYMFDMLIGKHPLYLRAIELAHKAALSDSCVLIEGETGTGKELFAQSIHNECARKEKPFIAVNCSAIPDTLLEGVLFGTVKGAYPGAEDRAGFFEQAFGGTLFLDEVNCMSIQLQAKVLHALQENYIRRLGGTKDLLIDVRVIATSSESLIPLIKNGMFRKDLYYKLNIITIKIPALRERKDDIALLSDYFVKYFNAKMGKDIWTLSVELQEAFRNYAWIGNIRELENVIESAMTMVDSEKPYFNEERVSLDHVLEGKHLPLHVDIVSMSNIITETGSVELNGYRGNLSAYLENTEKKILLECIAQASGNISEAARLLGISRQSLQYKIKLFHIER